MRTRQMQRGQEDVEVAPALLPCFVARVPAFRDVALCSSNAQCPAMHSGQTLMLQHAYRQGRRLLFAQSYFDSSQCSPKWSVSRAVTFWLRYPIARNILASWSGNELRSACDRSRFLTEVISLKSCAAAGHDLVKCGLLIKQGQRENICL